MSREPAVNPTATSSSSARIDAAASMFLFTLPFLAMSPIAAAIFPEDEFMWETRARHECCDRAAIDRFILSEVTASSRLFDKYAVASADANDAAALVREHTLVRATAFAALPAAAAKLHASALRMGGDASGRGGRRFLLELVSCGRHHTSAAFARCSRQAVRFSHTPFRPPFSCVAASSSSTGTRPRRNPTS